MIKYHHCPMTWSYHITWLHDDDHMLDLEVLWSDMWSWFTSKTNKMITWDGCHWYWDTITKITQFHTFWEKLCCLNIIAASLKVLVKQVLYGFLVRFLPTKEFWTQPEWKFGIKCFFPGLGGISDQLLFVFCKHCYEKVQGQRTYECWQSFYKSCNSAAQEVAVCRKEVVVLLGHLKQGILV